MYSSRISIKGFVFVVASASFAAVGFSGCCEQTDVIDRHALVVRNCPEVSAPDTLASFSVGNGEFAFTADITGLQSFPREYSKGVSLGTMAQWAWHSFQNPDAFQPDETLAEYDFGRGRLEPYAIQFKEDGRQRDAANWFRCNPHRLHLGTLGLQLPSSISLDSIRDAHQCLDLWNGAILSRFSAGNTDFSVETVCHPTRDAVSAHVVSSGPVALNLRFPYPTGAHADDACDWNADDKHSVDVVKSWDGGALLRHTLDSTSYFINVSWQGAQASLSQFAKNYFLISAESGDISVSCEYLKSEPDSVAPSFADSRRAASAFWSNFWSNGAAVDFSLCTDERAPELERRVVLSQYLLAIQCAGSTPPQETGLTYNSWFGKFHLEMIWWHQSWLPLWGHDSLLARTMSWYDSVEPVARSIAQRQGFDGVRWMKMTDPSGTEAPSKTGSFLIWQQPHYIYLAELLYRANPTAETLDKYYRLVQETAKFMFSFASYDSANCRYVLKGAIPAQETLRASETVNPPFELSYWDFALRTAQLWRERKGLKRVAEWDDLLAKLSPLAFNEDGLYLAAETAPETYKDVRFTSDHMAVLGAVGILPMNKLIRQDYMKATFDWVWDNWNWAKTWGWDYPMTAMNAARMGEPDKAVDALFLGKKTNTYLVNGHNFQDARLRCYLPGNGGLLTAVALMCAGWDGCNVKNPGFPKNGKWNVRWEGLRPMP